MIGHDTQHRQTTSSPAVGTQDSCAIMVNTGRCDHCGTQECLPDSLLNLHGGLRASGGHSCDWQSMHSCHMATGKGPAIRPQGRGQRSGPSERSTSTTGLGVTAALAGTAQKFVLVYRPPDVSSDPPKPAPTKTVATQWLLDEHLIPQTCTVRLLIRLFSKPAPAVRAHACSTHIRTAGSAPRCGS